MAYIGKKPEVNLNRKDDSINENDIVDRAISSDKIQYFRDDDDMTSEYSNTSLASQESIKTYADTKEAKIATQATAGLFGTYTQLDTSGSALAESNDYLAQSDGFILGYCSGAETQIWISTVRSNVTSQLDAYRRGASTAGQNYANQYGYAICPVAKGEYIRILYNNNLGITYTGWMPFGTGGLVKQS